VLLPCMSKLIDDFVFHPCFLDISLFIVEHIGGMMINVSGY
jgi:hypothetical protein